MKTTTIIFGVAWFLFGLDCNNATRLMAAQSPAQLRPLIGGKWVPTNSASKVVSVQVLGKYAYVAVGASGLAVIDISDPEAPVRVGGYDTDGNALGVAVAGSFAYVADHTNGLQVIDVSNPTNCVRVGGCATTVYKTGGARAVAVAGNYAYVADSRAGLQVIDVSNPANCVLVGTYYTYYYAVGVAAASDWVYLAVDQVAGLQVIDVRSPASPSQTGYAISDFSQDVALAGRYAYMATTYNGLQVFDVSNPTNCVRVGHCDTPGYGQGVAVAGNYAYVADGLAGVQVIDVSNPTNCVWVGGYDTDGYAFDVAVAGNSIYVADQNALVILPTVPNVQFAVRVQALPNVPFTIEAATNLSGPLSWKPLLTTNLPVMPFDYVDFDVKISEKPQKLYRVRQP